MINLHHLTQHIMLCHTGDRIMTTLWCQFTLHIPVAVCRTSARRACSAAYKRIFTNVQLQKLLVSRAAACRRGWTWVYRCSCGNRSVPWCWLSAARPPPTPVSVECRPLPASHTHYILWNQPFKVTYLHSRCPSVRKYWSTAVRPHRSSKCGECLVDCQGQMQTCI